MQNLYLPKGIKAFSRAIVMAVALLVLYSTSSLAQQLRPQIPLLSLVGAGQGRMNSTGNGTNYPDDRIWVPRAANINTDPREILVPVFIKNCWFTGVDPRFNANNRPIYSFEFEVQYDERALEVVGIQKFGPNPDDTFSLAKSFELSWNDARDITYRTTIGPPTNDRFFGRRVRIAGSSMSPLPPSPNPTGGDVYDPAADCDQREFVELLYVRFRVVSRTNESRSTPLILMNDSLRYNELDVATESPFPGFTEYPVPTGTNTGLFGLNRLENPIEPTKPGTVWINITDIPRIGFLPNVGPSAEVRQVNLNEWELTRPIFIQDGNQTPSTAFRDINIVNEITQTRVTDINVESDAEWLTFRLLQGHSNGGFNPIPQLTRNGIIDYIDNGILGFPNPGTRNADSTLTTSLELPLTLRINADPSKTESVKDTIEDRSGIYTGYITFRTNSMEFSPVRLKVTFIVIRNPLEPNNDINNRAQQGRGIELTITNSGVNNIGGIPDTARVLFGTGLRATDGVDTLFGEFPHPVGQPTGAFTARFYPPVTSGRYGAPNGLGDILGRYQSRDFRDVRTDTTIAYRLRFGSDTSVKFPIVISYDTASFPVGAELFLRDALNGTKLNVNLRRTTPLGGGRYSYTITDASITDVIIEYTLPTVTRFPVINRGWNLLSLPVRPSASNYRDIFRNAQNIPLFFTKNQYQDEQNPKVGYGYFIRYGDLLDSFIAGSRVVNIDQNDQVLVTEGWNTIGALTCPVNVSAIQFDPFGPTPAQRIGSIYGYVTDRGYVEVSELQPGLGYWMKITGNGYLKMTGKCGSGAKAGEAIVDRSELAGAARVTVTDGTRNSELYIANAELASNVAYQLPPAPPTEMFDVRFANNSYVADATSPVIRTQGMSYPFEVSIANPAINYTVVDAVTGAALGTITKSNNKVVINNTKVQTVKLLGQTAGVAGFDMVVMQDAVRFSVPQDGNVTLKVYNMLGQEVATLFEGMMNAGATTVKFDASTLVNGSYIVKLSAGEMVNVRTISVTK